MRKKIEGNLPESILAEGELVIKEARKNNDVMMHGIMISREGPGGSQMCIRDRLKALFEKQWESIVGNCDGFLYLGGNEQSTHKYVSELLGKATIDTNTYGKRDVYKRHH